MQDIRFLPDQALNVPADNPFQDDEHAEDLYFTLSDAVYQADADRRVRFVHFYEDAFLIAEVPPVNSRELHLVCLPDADPVLARSTEYALVSPDTEDREQMRLIS
jgi:hypothetical protein